MIVVGLDLAASASGLVVVRSDAARVVRAMGSTTLKRHGSASTVAMCRMAAEVCTWVTEHKPDLVVLEDVFAPPAKKRDDETFAQAQKRAASQRQYALDNARLGGMVEYQLWSELLATQRLHPAAWRARALGRSEKSHGQWAKLDIPLALYKRYAAEFSDEHQAMAFGLAVAALVDQGGSDDGGRTGRARQGSGPASVQARLV